jgi:hypothetical protein
VKRNAIAALVLGAVILGSLAAAAAAVRRATSDFLELYHRHLSARMNTGVAQRADDAAKADYRDALARADAAQAVYAARTGLLSGDWRYHDLFERTGYKRDDVVRVAPGSGFLFLEGSAAASADGGELVDVTAGSSAASAGALTPGHRYLAGEDAVVSVTILSDAAYLAPQGYVCALPSETAALPFTDIVSTGWYYSYVHYVYSAKLFNGVSETQFSPSASMTRAMLPPCFTVWPVRPALRTGRAAALPTFPQAAGMKPP